MSKKTRTPAPSGGAVVGRQVVLQQQHHSGPLPSPETLARYDQLLPGTAQRIIAMAEREQAHAISQQQIALQSDVRAREGALAILRRGQIFALIVALVGIAVAAGLALAGRETVASVIAGSVLVALVTAFLGTRKGSQPDKVKDPS